MIKVSTFRRVDYNALLKAGMPRTQKAFSRKETSMSTCITFEVTNKIYKALDLDNRSDVTIQTVR